MAENTKIEWAHHTWNPWWGCSKVSPACDHCYAERDAKRFAPGRVLWGVGAERRVFGEKHWAEPLKWNARAARTGKRERVFCASMADVFDKDGPEEERAKLWRLIEATPHLDWLLLTKRIGNVEKMVPPDWLKRDVGRSIPDRWPRNARVGATIVTQDEYDRDIGKLLRLPAPNFLSLEPMLGHIDLRLGGASTPLRRLEWVIAGGESGPHARPAHPDWFRSLRDQCAAAGVPFLFKQWGEWTTQAYAVSPTAPATVAVAHDGSTLPMGEARARVDVGQRFHCMYRVGKKAAGRLLDGVTHDGVPTL